MTTEFNESKSLVKMFHAVVDGRLDGKNIIKNENRKNDKCRLNVKNH